MQSVTLLGYALLGLLHGKASSGYDLRKIFTETPMGRFSDSPGAIYPALRRLEQRKLIIESAIVQPTKRRRKALQLTLEGRVALKAWLRTPLERADVTSHMPTLMLKFAFMDGVLGEAATLRFLCSLQQELNAYIPSLASYIREESGRLPRSGKLALESGWRGYRAQAQWVAHAISIYGGTAN
jgi:DNA-binding PadR family transcriptional regulator